ncbi:alpha-xylosidase 1-like [Cucurbita maxima]|uniref:Alpha-xylosidase 1-like n=1 Tax=Cucurbita maxima TaxID=3661 RepID=A0A6J1KQ40_CUCMA|nr:alpha-xylosidase 1-like [Cucurbita maxima]
MATLQLQAPSFHALFLFSLFFFGLCNFGVKSADALPSKKIGNGYHLISVGEAPGGGILGFLQVNVESQFYGADIPFLQLFVKHETEHRLRVHITDAKKKRWEVPYNLLPRQSPPPPRRAVVFPKNNVTISEYAGSELIFSYSANPFSFTVKRKSNGETLFDSGSDESDPFNSLVFKDQYLEISTKLPESAALYGLGENTQPKGMKLQPNEPYTLYTTDVAAVTLNTDLYGSHPVYMDLRNGGGGGEANAHGVLLLNSNGMDVFYRGNSLTYKIIGGVLDLYFFAGPSPLSVVDQYTAFVGRPAPMPYWALGFHQCRWGYRNLSVVEDVVENYRKAKIPLDVIWNDDDHMDGHKDFTLNPISYPHPALLSFLNKIHSSGMKYIVLIDPGIAVNSTYAVYQRALAKDVFIKHQGHPYLAQVWPGPVHFPDFLNPATVSWWADEISRFHQLVPVNGLWIDMNEASNFCTGKCTIPVGKQCPNATGPGWICCLDCKNITDTRWDDPPYKINASGLQVPIGYKTIATSAVHYNGVLEYDAHSLYGFSQAIATHKALQGLEGKRPFVLTRSTFVGSGKYAAHWTGDNQGTWQDLKYSISTVLNFGIFGIPMVGSDICGFYPAPTEELCNRWIEVGAFYPFSRDHANFYSPRQELYQWESVATSARNALGMRYKILPYLYTLSYEAHIKGAPIARPLFFSFPNYAECYGVSTQFLLGQSLMISPVLEQSKTEVTALFPPGTWYDLFNMTNVIMSKKGRYVTLHAPLHVINVHLYQNAILPMQQGGMISKEARATPFSLVVTFPAGESDGEARGYLFLDDDEQPEMKIAKGTSTYVEFYGVKNNGRVKIWSEVAAGQFALDKGLIVEKVIVLGLDGSGKAKEVFVDGAPVAAGVSASTVEQNIEQEPLGEDGERGKSLMVEVSGLSLPIGRSFKLSWQMGS